MTVKKNRKKAKKRKKKYIGDVASVVAIASGVVVWIAYVTGVIVIARVVAHVALDLLYIKQLAFK